MSTERCCKCCCSETGRGLVDGHWEITSAMHRGIGCIRDCSPPHTNPQLHLCCAFCSLSTKIWFKLSVNKCAACQHKWQREWARRQSPPLTINREKQSKEAININKVLTTIDYLALRWWAMMVMNLNSYTPLINILTFPFKRPIRQGFLCLRTTADAPAAHRPCCACCDISVGCTGNCSSAQHPAVSSLTVRRTVTSISCIWVWASQQLFPLVHTQPVQKKYTVEKARSPLAEPSVSGEIVASWAIGSVLRVTGRKDKWPRCGKSLCMTYRAAEDMRTQWHYTAFYHSDEGLRCLGMAQNQGHH